MSFSRNLTGKIAVVTGGSRGIGAAVASRLAEGGANVILTYATIADAAQAVAKVCRSHDVLAEAEKHNG